MKAVIFDLDQTIVDFVDMKVRCCKAAMNAMIKAGLKMKKKEAMHLLFKLYNKYGWEDQKIFQKFLKQQNKKVDWKIMAPAIVAYRNAKKLKLYPGVKTTLRRLRKRGYKLAILSAAPKIQVWTRMASLDLIDYFDVVITADDTKKRKPHPMAFKTVLKKLAVKPENTTMVGDMIGDDIKPANKLGMKTIFAPYGIDTTLQYAHAYGIDIKEYHAKNEADHTIKRFSDLLKILK